MNTAFVAAICRDPVRVECISKFERLPEEHKRAVRMLVDRLYQQTLADNDTNVVHLFPAK